MHGLGSTHNFLGLENPIHFNFPTSNVVIQALPYEHTSSYKQGSIAGPEAIIKASQFVEFYDEELDMETCFDTGICTLPPIQFKEKVDNEAMCLIETQTKELLKKDKFVVSFGAEHTASYGIIKAMKSKYDNLSILQIDAHSDLREEYEGSKWSHACVMARVNELNVKIAQVGIRAQCKEEAELIKTSKNIQTTYAHEMGTSENWISEITTHLTGHVYITIDADGFDPSIMPAVGTPEPNGLQWQQAISLFKHIFAKKNIVGFDIVECAPNGMDSNTEYSLAKLAYKLIGLKYRKHQ